MTTKKYAAFIVCRGHGDDWEQYSICSSLDYALDEVHDLNGPDEGKDRGYYVWTASLGSKEELEDLFEDEMSDEFANQFLVKE